MKPPDTKATEKPSRPMVRTSVRAPGVSRTAARTSSRTETGSPARAATRSCRLAVKSSSPRIARSVTAATSADRPACWASSSITSSWIRVESTSITTSRRPRRARPGRRDRDVHLPGRRLERQLAPEGVDVVDRRDVELEGADRVARQPPDPVDVGPARGQHRRDGGDRQRPERSADQGDVQGLTAARRAVAVPRGARDLHAQLASRSRGRRCQRTLLMPGRDEDAEGQPPADDHLLDVDAPRRPAPTARRRPPR